MSYSTSSKRFTLDFAKKAILGTKASYDKAGKGYGPIYDELVALLTAHPDFACVVKEPKEPAKPKRTYKGMDIPFMRDYLSAVGNDSTLKTIDALIANAKEEKLSSYPDVKREFFGACPEFDYAVAKKIVSEYRHAKTVAAAMKASATNTADLAPAANF